MTLSEYLEKFAKLDHLQIVGPFYTAQKLQEPVIYIDRGANFRDKVSGICVGDGDSSMVPMDVTLPARKDYSDFAYVLSQIPNNFKEISLFGFLGGRKDHEWINLLEVERFLKGRKDTRVNWGEGVYSFSKGAWEMQHKGVFSLFSLNKISLKLQGAIEYPFDGELIPMSSNGLSNEAQGKIKMQTSGGLHLFFVDSFNV